VVLTLGLTVSVKRPSKSSAVRRGFFPLVHGRTQYADYRPGLLAHPGWFKDADLAWLKEYLYPDVAGTAPRFGARALAEKLREPGGERWIYLRRDSLVVFGVWAVATELSIVEPLMTHEMIKYHDRVERGRLLDAFVGYATTSEILCRERLVPPRNLGPYRAVYEEYVRPRWQETQHIDGWQAATRTSEVELELEPASRGSGPGDAILSRVSRRHVQVHPSSQDDQLWRAAAVRRGQVSLILGMPSLFYAERCVFDVVTTAETGRDLRFDRPGGGTSAPQPWRWAAACLALVLLAIVAWFVVHSLSSATPP
jgi:hypothetical protein